jgi:uncharacterized protein YbcI
MTQAPADEREKRGDTLLARISTEMVKAQKEFFGKGPTRAKSYFFDDMLLIVMRGGLTTAEKTMLAMDQADAVRSFRQVFENEMTGRLTETIEGLTGRNVLAYQSQVMFDPDIVVEMFVFDDTVEAHAIEATARGLLGDEPVGEVTTDDDEPSPTGCD